MTVSYRRVTLKRVAALGTGHTPSRANAEYWLDCTIPWLTLADVGPLRDGTVAVITETKEKISELGVANSSAVIHPAGTVVMSRTASVGYSGILGTDMATSQDYVTWTCGPRIEPRFLLHSLRGLRNEILASRMGSTHQTIYMPDVERIRVPLPPVEEQRRIVDFLDAETARIDALITAKQRMIGILREQLQQRASIATDLRPTVSLRRVLASVKTGATPSDSRRVDVEGGVPWLTPSDFDSTLRLRVAARRVSALAVVDGEVPLFPGNSVAVIGIGATAGRVAHLPDPATGNQQVTALTPGPTLHARFLAWFLWARSDELRLRAPYTTLPILNNEYLRSIRIALPPWETQANVALRLDTRAERTANLASTLTRQIELLRERRQALITAAVSGELTV